MKLKHLDSSLSSVKTKFDSPQVTLEQYSTPSRLAASVVLEALENGDLGEGLTVCDLGCGPGIFSLAAALVGCSRVISIDVCPDALLQAKQNSKELEFSHVIDLIRAEVICNSAHSSKGEPEKAKKTKKKGKGRKKGVLRKLEPELRLEIPSYNIGNDGIPLENKCVDTVITNPPFGTKDNAGIDVSFLAAACRLAKKSVYSFHKSSTRKFIVKTVKEWNLNIEVIPEIKFDIPNVYEFHKEKNVQIEVDLFHIWHREEVFDTIRERIRNVELDLDDQDEAESDEEIQGTIE